MQLQELPAAETEAAYIASVIPGSNALVGEQATAEAVSKRINDYRILHFATHGNLDVTLPLLSAVYLANGDNLTV
jgi:CHAT domain-containing protein